MIDEIVGLIDEMKIYEGVIIENLLFCRDITQCCLLKNFYII